MDEKEVLTKAIEKAKLNGLDKSATLNWAKNRIDFSWGSIGEGYFIFDHEFAKAFWGEENTCFICGSTTPEVNETHNSNGDDRDVNCSGCGAEWMSKSEFSEEGNYIPFWEYQLQQMVLAPNKVMYMKDYL